MNGKANPQETAAIFADLQSVVDAVPDVAVVLKPDSTILCVNERWRAFSRENGGNQRSHHVGESYLHVCRKAANAGDEIAARMDVGLSEVLSEGREFTLEYPCHSAIDRRWFVVTARPLDIEGERFAMLLHRDVSEVKQRELETSEALLHMSNLAEIVAAMPDAVVGMDLSGRITSWNNAAQLLYGYSANEIIGQTIDRLFPSDWDETVEQYVSELISREHSQFEVVRQTKSGQRRLIEITAAPVRSADGEIVGVSNVNRDVTERHRSEQRLRDVLNNLFAFVGVLDPDGTLVEVNRAPLEAAGLDTSDVIGKKFWDCYWWSYSPEAQQQLKTACETVRTGEVIRYDTKVRIAGGELIWIDFQLAPLLNSEGAVESIVPSGIDITERKAALDALRNSRDTFSNLVQHSPFGIYTVDADFRLANVSDGAQKVFSTVRPLIGRDFAEILRILWPEPFATEAIGRFRHTLDTGEAYRSPATIERRSDIDEVEAYDWKIERITMPDGRPGVVCNFYDLSERQRHEEHIQFLMKEVNHRAKNLLTVVISMARQTSRGRTPQEFIDQFSNRLLGLAASQDLIVRGNWGGVTVTDLVRSQLHHFLEDANQGRVEIAGADLLLTPAAAQGIGMALHELSTNAVKYGSLSVPKGSVCIQWQSSPDKDTFQIRWIERDGPPVSPPDNVGFGQTVIERMAAASVGGQVELNYSPSGFSWALQAPISEIVPITSEFSSQRPRSDQK